MVFLTFLIYNYSYIIPMLDKNQTIFHLNYISNFNINPKHRIKMVFITFIVIKPINDHIC